jgi:CubicO group peptidase (beta-lactamase class C family)
MNLTCVRAHRIAGVVLCLVSIGLAGSRKGLSNLGKEANEYLRRAEGFGYSGAYLIVRDGKILLREGYGFADRKRNRRNTPSTVFDIGSLAKQFTATAILQLEAAGKLRMEDRISSLLPDVPEDKRNITVHQLLTHTSGLRADLPLGPLAKFGYYENVPRDEALKRIFSTRLRTSPGESFAYSNIGYALLAAIIEKVSGEEYREYLRTHLFAPAGMKHTGFWGADLPHGVLIARGYDDQGETTDLSQWDGSSWADRGAGGITSTIDDLYKWHLAFEGDRILTSTSKQKMLTPFQNNYGYGWFIQKSTKGVTLIQHGGDLIGFGAQFTWIPSTSTLLISTCNLSFDDIGARHMIDRAIRRMALGEPFTALPPIDRSTKFESDLLGNYRLASGDTLTILRDHLGLRIGARGESAAELLAPDTPEDRQARQQFAQQVNVWLKEMTTPGDPLTELTKAAGPGGSEFARAVKEEFDGTCVEKGERSGYRFLGAAAAGQPIGGWAAIAQINRKNGDCFYKFKIVAEGMIAMTDTRAPEYAIQLPLQPLAGDAFAGWDIVHEKGIEVRLIREGKAITGLKIHSGEQTVTAMRE